MEVRTVNVALGRVSAPAPDVLARCGVPVVSDAFALALFSSVLLQRQS